MEVATKLPWPIRTHTAYEPFYGALPDPSETRFRVWAPYAERVDVLVQQEQTAAHSMRRGPNGLFEARIEGVAAGARYRYRLNGGEALPDPASRYQPDGIDGPSMVIDPSRFRWTDSAWTGVDPRQLVIYEIHVGTFTRRGTFAGAESCLGALSDLGVTAVELMPIAEFAGRWNWGYDGVDLFAPSHNYGTPDALRRFVDAAHARGIAVIVDCVYNHFGPAGAYIHTFSPQFRTAKYETPWGSGVNLDGEQCAMVRRFFIDNALHWVHEYHVDGLRLDATHALRDTSETHFLADLRDRIHGSLSGRRVLLFAEDERNEATIVRDRREEGYGFDGVWADDFHHHVRRAVAGDHEGYFQSFSGSTRDLAETLRRGWFYTGQHSAHLGAPRGTDTAGVPLTRFVTCLQNHDQVGNRAFGERLHHEIELNVYRAISALLLLAPETPLLFMGQEWAASTPFRFFTDHDPELGKAVTEGRRAEFAAFSAFADPSTRDMIPDPQKEATFLASVLAWDERERPPHRLILRLYQELLRMRRTLAPPFDVDAATIEAIDDDTLLIARRSASRQSRHVAVIRLRGAGEIVVREAAPDLRVVMTTEDAEFAERGQPPAIETSGVLAIGFQCPAAVILST